MNEDRAAKLLGELYAIEETVRMLIDAHPQDDELRRVMRERLQSARDAGLFQSVHEGVFEGWDRAVRRMLGPSSADPPTPR